MSLSRKILSIGLSPIIILILGAYICGYILFKNNQRTEAYLNIYEKRQQKLTKIYHHLGYGGGIHSFKNYILRGDEKYRIEAIKDMHESVLTINEYLNDPEITEVEKASLKNLQFTVNEYLQKTSIARKLIEEGKTQDIVDSAVKVDDTLAVSSLKKLDDFLHQKRISETKNLLQSQNNALITISIIFVLGLFISILLSHAASLKIINSIQKLLNISNRIKRGDYNIEKESKEDITEGELQNLAETMLDMSDSIKKGFENLEQSNEELTNFAFVASHDLQEPIKKISNYSDLLSFELSGTKSQKSHAYLKEIKDSAVHMINLIKALLNYSQLTSDKTILENIDLNEVIQTCQNNLSHLIKENYVQLITSDLPIIQGNPTLLASLFQNLITNSIKYRKHDEQLTISISATALNQGSVEIHYKDNGIGFNLKYLDTILRPFGRIHNKKDYPSLGIGLPLCKKIIEKHGGQLKVQSAENKGALFEFDLKVG